MSSIRYEVEVKDNFGGWSVDIYVAEIINGDVSIATIQEGKLFYVKIKPFESCPPTFTLPKDIWVLMREKLIDQQIKSKETIEGELVATKYHLEDLRTLLKIQK